MSALFISCGSEIWHYDVKVLPNNECIFNSYSFVNLPAAISFYTENRLGSVFLKEPVSLLSVSQNHHYKLQPHSHAKLYS